MANEVKITVRVQNSGKAGLEAVNKDVDDYAKKFAQTFASRLTESLSRTLGTQLLQRVQAVGEQAQASARTAGDRIGDTIGRRAADRISTRITERLRDSRGRFMSPDGARSGGLSDRGREKITVEVEPDRRSFLSRLTELAKSGAGRVGEALRGGLASVFSGDLISVIVKVVVGGIVTAIGSSAIGAALTATILAALGGGAIAIGIAGALKDPRIQTAIKGIGDKLKEMFESFSSNFKGPLEDFLAPGNDGGGGLIGVIEQITPMVEHLGRVLGPIAGKLGDGIIGMLQNMLPPLLRAIENSAPVLKELADNLPELGKKIGDFFEKISNGSPEAAVFLNDLLWLFGKIIDVIGNIISNLTFLYGVFRTIFNGMIVTMHEFLVAAVIAFGWIPGIGPKLKGLEAKFREFRNSANDQLRGIRDRTVNIRIRVLGLAAARAALDVGRMLANMAHGGIRGAADGGLRSGLTWVGEQGPELVKLPPGAQVHPAGQSARMANTIGGGGGVAVTVRPAAPIGASRELMDVILRSLRWEVGNHYGGDVQLALGGGS